MDGGNRIKHTNNQRTSLFPSAFSVVTRYFDSAIAFVCFVTDFHSKKTKIVKTKQRPHNWILFSF